SMGRADCLSDDGDARIARLVLARQPERVPVHSLARGNAAGETSSASGDGTTGQQANLNRHTHFDRIRAFLLAVPDYDHIRNESTDYVDYAEVKLRPQEAGL